MCIVNVNALKQADLGTSYRVIARVSCIMLATTWPDVGSIKLLPEDHDWYASCQVVASTSPAILDSWNQFHAPSCHPSRSRGVQWWHWSNGEERQTAIYHLVSSFLLMLKILCCDERSLDTCQPQPAATSGPSNCNLWRAQVTNLPLWMLFGAWSLQVLANIGWMGAAKEGGSHIGVTLPFLLTQQKYSHAVRAERPRCTEGHCF